MPMIQHEVTALRLSASTTCKSLCLRVRKAKRANSIAASCNLPEVEKPAALKPRGGFWLKAGDRQIHVGTEDRR